MSNPPHVLPDTLGGQHCLPKMHAKQVFGHLSHSCLHPPCDQLTCHLFIDPAPHNILRLRNFRTGSIREIYNLQEEWSSSNKAAGDTYLGFIFHALTCYPFCGETFIRTCVYRSALMTYAVVFCVETHANTRRSISFSRLDCFM